MRPLRGDPDYRLTIATLSKNFPISSASNCRLIFIVALRGNSLYQIKYPTTRLK